MIFGQGKSVKTKMSDSALILASSSRFRRRLLEQLDLPFRCISPDIDETPLPNESGEALVRRLSIEKAYAVAHELSGAIVVGSDQTAVHDGQIVGKPKDHAEAVSQLTNSSGKIITFYTGIALVNTNNNSLQVGVIPYQVHFRTITLEQIERYLERAQPYECCGSLRVDGLGIALLKRLRGDDPSALIGLPLTKLVQMLKKEGLDVI